MQDYLNMLDKVPSSANFTEFLRDYLEHGNQLPTTEFAKLDSVFDCDFAEVFTKYYYMREIGFQTEELFKHKLEIFCMVEIPYIIEKATKLKTEFASIFNTGYSITTLTSQENSLETESKDFKKPIDKSGGTLTNDSLSGGNKQNNTGVLDGMQTITYSKNPKFNNIESVILYQEKFANIFHESIKVFEPLFMQVF